MNHIFSYWKNIQPINRSMMDESKFFQCSKMKWMNWADSKGLISPAPEGITFLGGVNDMPAGSIGYFQVNLEPGNYALISEVPNTISKNMLKTFKITE